MDDPTDTILFAVGVATLCLACIGCVGYVLRDSCKERKDKTEVLLKDGDDSVSEV